jgi:hypothetical protein
MFGLGLHDVQNDCDSVFIVIAHNTLIGVGSIPCDQAIPFIGVLCILIIWKSFVLGTFAHVYFTSQLLKV